MRQMMQAMGQKNLPEFNPDRGKSHRDYPKKSAVRTRECRREAHFAMAIESGACFRLSRRLV
jgi:hypothetical protein